MRLPKIGDQVLYVYAEYDLGDAHKNLVGEVRPATIVRDFSSGHPSQIDPTIACYNLSVDTDFENDGKGSGKYWASSRHYSEVAKPGTFHFREVVK